MNKKLILVSVLTLLFACLSFGQEKEGDWVNLKKGQSALGIEFREDSSVLFNGELLMGCGNSDWTESLEISKPSPKKGLSLVMCRFDDVAYIVNTQNKKVLTRDIVPKHEAFGSWVNWSPDERYFITVKGGEGINTIFFMYDLKTQRASEIALKIPGNEFEMDSFNAENFAWITNTSFQTQVDIVCNPYESNDCADYKPIRSYKVQANILTLKATHLLLKSKTTQISPQKKTAAKKTTPVQKKDSQFMDDDGSTYILVPKTPASLNIKSQTKSITSIRQIDFKNFTYMLTGGDEEDIETKTVKVKKGNFSNRKGRGSLYQDFDIGKVIYGDLTGDGEEEAIIESSITLYGGSPAAYTSTRAYYIYSLNAGKPVFLTRLEIDKDYEKIKGSEEYDECDEQLFVRSAKVENTTLILTTESSGLRCADKGYDVFLNYKWNGNTLVLAEKPVRRKAR